MFITSAVFVPKCNLVVNGARYLIYAHDAHALIFLPPPDDCTFPRDTCSLPACNMGPKPLPLSGPAYKILSFSHGAITRTFEHKMDYVTATVSEKPKQTLNRSSKSRLIFSASFTIFWPVFRHAAPNTYSKTTTTPKKVKNTNCPPLTLHHPAPPSCHSYRYQTHDLHWCHKYEGSMQRTLSEAEQECLPPAVFGGITSSTTTFSVPPIRKRGHLEFRNRRVLPPSPSKTMPRYLHPRLMFHSKALNEQIPIYRTCLPFYVTHVISILPNKKRTHTRTKSVVFHIIRYPRSLQHTGKKTHSRFP